MTHKAKCLIVQEVTAQTASTQTHADGWQGDKFAEVTRAALKLRRATTKALSEDARLLSDDDASTVYASPMQSMTPGHLASSGVRHMALAGRSCF